MNHKVFTVEGIIEKLIDDLALSVDPDLLGDHTSFSNDLGLDSLELYELISILEDESGVDLKNPTHAELATLGSLSLAFQKRATAPEEA